MDEFRLARTKSNINLYSLMMIPDTGAEMNTLPVEKNLKEEEKEAL